MSDDRYTDAFLVPIRKEKLDEYRRGAEACAGIWREHGAIDYCETVIDHDGIPDMRSFSDVAGASDEEVVVLAWAVFPSKEVRDSANEKIMSDPRVEEMGERMAGVFNCSRMVYGGFRTLVRG